MVDGESVDLANLLPANFFSLLRSTKWQERKDVIELFSKKLNQNPSLDPSTKCNEILEALAKVTFFFLGYSSSRFFFSTSKLGIFVFATVMNNV